MHQEISRRSQNLTIDAMLMLASRPTGIQRVSTQQEISSRRSVNPARTGFARFGIER